MKKLRFKVTPAGYQIQYKLNYLPFWLNLKTTDTQGLTYRLIFEEVTEARLYCAYNNSLLT